MEEGVYILNIDIENITCFGIHSKLNLADNNNQWNKWTIILGNNSTGKTTLLKIIAGLEYELSVQNRKYSFSNNTFFYKNLGEILFNSKGRNLKVRVLVSQPFSENYYLSLRYERGVYSIDSTDILANPLTIYGYGANRFMSRNSIIESKPDNTATLFDEDAKLINAEEWLLQLDYTASKPSKLQEFAAKRREQVKEILLEILPDIEAIQFTEPTKRSLKSTVEFQTPYGWVTIHQLSLGYKTMVAWMVDLAARLFERYPDSDNPLAEPAIVLVDEIDLHMHPKWQRKIFDYLSEKFPKTQFIVTAHSPLIVQSAPKDANIVLLRREGDHVVIDNDIQSVHNWRIDQILNSDLFGNIPQLPPDEEKWMEERVQLIQKVNLTDTEKQRLTELNEKAYDLPTADNQRDIEAMQIIRDAADYLKSKNTGTPA